MPALTCKSLPWLTCLLRPKTRAPARTGVAARANPVPPHCGYHYDGLPRRFFEGWYFRVVLDDGDSFAVIYSVEDPALLDSQQKGVGIQIMGPEDTYLAHFTSSTSHFWGDPASLSLTATFPPAAAARGPIPADSFLGGGTYGGQITASNGECHHVGSILDIPDGTAGSIPAHVSNATWDFKATPVYGWGAGVGKQQSTAGWLAALPVVFEPHWQVMTSLGKATGTMTWGDKKYDFVDAAYYAEKNWGGGFPRKWVWLQCNTWDFGGDDGLAVTAVGAVRKLLNVEGLNSPEEVVGMVGVHWKDEFIELYPTNATISWSVTPWGLWEFTGEGNDVYITLRATCDESKGVRLRAPTADQGLAPLCKDTFTADVIFRMWQRPTGSILPWSEIVKGDPTLEAVSGSCATEVGGGPWWDTWKGTAKMQDALKIVLQTTWGLDSALQQLPRELKPPGL